jgi:hypothetical protein
MLTALFMTLDGYIVFKETLYILKILHKIFVNFFFIGTVF